MTAAALVRSLIAAGIGIWTDGDLLVLSGASRPTGHLLEEVRSAKVAVLQYLGALALWTEEDWNALYDERAGIMEFDGGLPRVDAEAAGAEEVNLLRSLVRSLDG